MVRTLDDLCNLFDKYEVFDEVIQIDRSFYASTDAIYTDGKYKSNINKDGYIHITSIQNASYVIFIDIEHNTYLCIYKYIPQTKYKLIKQKLQFLKNKIKELHQHDQYIIDHDHTAITNETTPTNIIEDDEIYDLNVDDDVIDINTFTCSECDSTDKFIFNRSKTNPDALETRCSKCKTEYVFMPSKYYKLESKRVIYFKSEVSSRQIDIKSTNKSKTDVACDAAKAIIDKFTNKDIIEDTKTALDSIAESNTMTLK